MSSWDFECGTCGKIFASGWKARDKHCKATGHSRPNNECDTCARHFRNQRGCWKHMNALNHFAEVCSICDETWPDAEERKRHEHDDHLYCKDCDRSFRNRNNLKMHLTSRVHLGTNMACPFCSRCFTTATGVAHHIETGSCPKAPNVNRDVVYELVRSKDPSGLISKHLIGWKGSATYEVTARTWNGSGYECYFCPREFTTLHGLNQHVNSPNHQRKLYHCPKRSCRQDFVSLAAIINHLESEACGFTKFDNVQKQFSAIIDPSRRLTFRG